VGYGLPFGQTHQHATAQAGQFAEHLIPIEVALAAGLGTHVHWDFFFQYAPLRPGEAFDCDKHQCSGRSLGGGTRLRVGLLPGAHYNPWLGAGVAVSYDKVNVDDGTVERAVGLLAGDYLRLSVGLDVRYSRYVGIGPYLEWSQSRYLAHFESWAGDIAFVDSVHNRATHNWLTLGVRGTLFP
jgi:hypothetical protein